MARHEGQVLFVRHALPGETVRAEVTSIGRKGRFVRADAVEVLVPSPIRRPPPCPVAVRCGGCDWQHATPAGARGLKAAVVREALARFAGIELPEAFEVLEVAGPGGGAGAGAGTGGAGTGGAGAGAHGAGAGTEGLGWRTRGTLAVADDGRAGFLAPRSHDVVVAGGCPQLDPRLAGLELFSRAWPPGSRVGFVAASIGPPLAFDVTTPPGEPVVERAAGREWLVAADGFWQVHPRAADALVAHVARMLAPEAGERLVDLYAGVGLFGLSVAASVEPGLEVTLVEGDRRACELAALNAGERSVRIERASVDRWTSRPDALGGTDLVILDPPRVGAGEAVVRAVADARPRAVAYVACDPVALARDLATFASAGYRLDELVALDLFPTTHHVECVAKLVRE